MKLTIIDPSNRSRTIAAYSGLDRHTAAELARIYRQYHPADNVQLSADESPTKDGNMTARLSPRQERKLTESIAALNAAARGLKSHNAGANRAKGTTPPGDWQEGLTPAQQKDVILRESLNIVCRRRYPNLKEGARKQS